MTERRGDVVGSSEMSHSQELAERWRLVGEVLRRLMTESQFEALVHSQEVAALSVGESSNASAGIEESYIET